MFMNGRWSQSYPLVFSLVIISLFIPARIEAQQKKYDQSLLKGLQWRSVGPFRGGRSTAVAGVTSQQNVFYFGATGGGVWKTNDGGINWEPISDEYFKTGSVGAITLTCALRNPCWTPRRSALSHARLACSTSVWSGQSLWSSGTGGVATFS